MSKALLGVVTAIFVTWLGAQVVEARAFPGRGGSSGGARPAAPAAAAALRNNADYGGYGDYGGDASFDFSPMQSQGPNVHASRQPWLEQSSIQNDMLAQARSENSAIAGGGRGNQNWWFQHEGSEVAQDHARGFNSSALAPRGLGIEAANPSPPVAMDIIQWPILLREPTFASRRALVEAPYRRSPPGLSVPTSEDYQAMVKTVTEMKAILEWLPAQGGVDTDEYNQAKRFLNELAQEARQRSEQGTTSKKKS